jgi:Transposase DDE domain
MEITSRAQPGPDPSSGWSVVLGERVLRLADSLELAPQWRRLGFGRPSRRVTSYAADQRIAAVLVGLACGLRGVAPGNLWVRPNTAVQQRLGGRFPDQGTVHRWLGQLTAEQAAGLRRHAHDVVRRHGRFWRELWSARRLVVDVDGQGLAARGRRFERARAGYLGGRIDRGYQRYVCYAGATGEVLDEVLLPGNVTAMSALPEILRGLNEVIPAGWRRRVVLRGDAHFGTVANLRRMRQAGYHYLCPLYSYWSKQKLQRQVQGRRGAWFALPDSTGRVRRLQFWRVPRCRLVGKGQRGVVCTRATVYRETAADGKAHWTVLVTDLERPSGPQLWREYNGRGGTIEEYNDQSERAYHLEVMRTGHYAGLNALQSLVGLCWNLTRWATEDLRLPPALAPAADRAGWVAAAALDLSHLMQRAQHSGLRLYRPAAGGPLEVEDTAATPESAAWRRCLQQPIQLRLRWTG